MATISVKITGLNEIRAKLERMGSALKNFTVEMGMVGEELTAYYAGMFPAKGDQYGKPWAALQPKTLAYKEKHMGAMKAGVSPSQPLIFSGKMQDSFKFESGPAALRVYNDVQSANGYNYFRAHQLGLGHNPQRIMMALNEDLKVKIRETIAKGLRARIEAS